MTSDEEVPVDGDPAPGGSRATHLKVLAEAMRAGTWSPPGFSDYELPEDFTPVEAGGIVWRRTPLDVDALLAADPEPPLTGRVLAAAAARGPDSRVSPLLPDELLLKITEFLGPRSPALLNLALASRAALALALPELVTAFSVSSFMGRMLDSDPDRHALREAARVLKHVVGAGLATRIRSVEADVNKSDVSRVLCRRVLAAVAHSGLRELRFGFFHRDDIATFCAADLRGLRHLELTIRRVRGPRFSFRSLPGMPALETAALRGDLNARLIEAVNRAAPRLTALELETPHYHKSWMAAVLELGLEPLIGSFRGSVAHFLELRRRSANFKPRHVYLCSKGRLDEVHAGDYRRLLELDWSGIHLRVGDFPTELLSLGWPRSAAGLIINLVYPWGLPAPLRKVFAAFARLKPGWLSLSGRDRRVWVRPSERDPRRYEAAVREGVMWARLLGADSLLCTDPDMLLRLHGMLQSPADDGGEEDEELLQSDLLAMWNAMAQSLLEGDGGVDGGGDQSSATDDEEAASDDDEADQEGLAGDDQSDAGPEGMPELD